MFRISDTPGIRGHPMNIHEYQAKQLLKDFGVPVSDGRVVLNADEAEARAAEMDGPIWVVKA